MVNIDGEAFTHTELLFQWLSLSFLIGPAFFGVKQDARNGNAASTNKYTAEVTFAKVTILFQSSSTQLRVTNDPKIQWSLYHEGPQKQWDENNKP